MHHQLLSQSADILRDDVSGVFSPERFGIERLPSLVGSIGADADLEGLPSCLDMLIMVPGGPIMLPEPYVSSSSVKAMLACALVHEDVLLPGWHRTRHLYLTVDRRQVKAGRTHRNAGWHFDGMQGIRYPDKLPACHQYVCSDACTTEFASAATDASGLDETRHNWFLSLGSQIPEDHATWRPRPLEIVCMSAYQLHRSPIAERDAWRTFMRLDVSCKRQDRLGNTLNPVLAAPFEHVPRAMPDGLGVPVSDSGWDGATRYGA